METSTDPLAQALIATSDRALQEARALLKIDQRQRAERCQGKIGETLATYGCRLEARPVPGSVPGQWAWQIIVVAD